MFNEEAVAEKCITTIMGVIKKLPQRIMLLVINDGSTDRTGFMLKKMQKKYPLLEVITHKKNKGYGGALQTGIHYALKKKITYCLHMDSDLTNDPKDIPKFIKIIPQGYDCVKASRYCKDSKVIGVPPYRKTISIIGNYLARALFRVGINDCTNGFRMVKLEKLKGITFEENNFSIILEELYYLKKRNATFKEIPYILTTRKNSQSHFIYKPSIFYDYFKYAFKSFFIF